MNFRSISSRHDVVNQIVQSALMKFHILSKLLDSQHVANYISINEWTVALLCCHGKNSSYVSTYLRWFGFLSYGYISLKSPNGFLI